MEVFKEHNCQLHRYLLIPMPDFISFFQEFPALVVSPQLTEAFAFVKIEITANKICISLVNIKFLQCFLEHAYGEIIFAKIIRMKIKRLFDSRLTFLHGLDFRYRFFMLACFGIYTCQPAIKYSIIAFVFAE